MRRVACTLVLLLLALVLPGVRAEAVSFTDLEHHWSRPEVEALAARGLVQGLPDGGFHPDRPVTRAELVKLLVVALEGPETARMLATLPSSFRDLGPHHWASGYVESAYERGLAAGYADGTFRPDQAVTRAEVATMLARAGGWEAEAFRISNPRAELPFRDAAAIPAWAAGHVLVLFRRGLVGGFPDGTFRPGAATTRAEAAALITRFLRHRGSLYDLVGEVVEVLPPGGLTVATPSGRHYQIVLRPAAPCYRNGLPAAPADLRELDEVRLIMSATGEVLYLEALLWDARATVKAVNPTERTLRLAPLAGGQETEVRVATSARLVREGSPAELGDFRAGDRVYLMVNSQTGEARVIWGARVNLEGEVLRVDAAGRLEIALAPGVRRLIWPAPSPVVLINGRPATWNDVRVKDHVAVAFAPDGAAVFLDVTRAGEGD